MLLIKNEIFEGLFLGSTSGLKIFFVFFIAGGTDV